MRPHKRDIPPTPALQPYKPTYLPLGTSWPPLCRKRSHCRSSPSPGCPSASARERGWSWGQGSQAARASPGQRQQPHPYHQLQHVVRHVAMVVAHAVGRGVAEDDRGLGELQSGLHRGHGYVGQVDDDAQPVHLLHDALRGDGIRGPVQPRGSWMTPWDQAGCTAPTCVHMTFWGLSSPRPPLTCPKDERP